MTELRLNNFRKLAEFFEDCGAFRKELRLCKTTKDLVNLIEMWDDDIMEQLHNKGRRMYEIDVQDLEEHDYRPLINHSVINEMKMRLFFEMIDDITLTEMEALFNQYRPGKAAVNQLSIAI